MLQLKTSIWAWHKNCIFVVSALFCAFLTEDGGHIFVLAANMGLLVACHWVIF